jgi:hypothetical protein
LRTDTYRLKIKSAEDFHPPEKRFAGSTAPERIVLRYWHMETSGFHIAFSDKVSSAALTYARVDLGRWICDCPWCGSAQNASREDHRFFCVECGNSPAGGQWISVVWPSESDIAEIEDLLGRRHKRNQWYTPADAATAPDHFVRETIADLAAENVAHKVA